MSRMVPLRHAARVLAAGVGPGACIGAAYILRPAPIRLDAASSGQVRRPRLASTKISPKAVQQISSGSLSGEYPPRVVHPHFYFCVVTSAYQVSAPVWSLLSSLVRS